MPDWLTKASQTLSRTAPREPEPFRLTCPCGKVVEGMRQERYQQVICRECGEALFVLPLDVYPRAVLKVPKKSWRKSAKRKKSSAETMAAVPSGPPLQERIAQRAKVAGAKVTNRMRGAGRRVRSVFTAFRLVVLAIIAVVIVTGHWALNSRLRENAEREFREAKDRGYEALGEGSFLTAERELRTACDALDVLGRDDQLGREVRQMWREAAALSHLADVSLFEILEDAEEHSSDGPSAWAERFDSQYAGQWLVLETRLRPSADASGGRTVSVDLPLSFQRSPVALEVDPSVFERLEFEGETVEAIFAVQLQQCRWEFGPSPRWIVTFEPESTFLWCNFDTYAALGFVFDDFHTEDHVREILARQMRVMGVQE